ncbi:hypothetical protein niasHT_016363 [Heterodera trifolii]|uniref:Uncharacterized protein n=1 Tax=Heterodera trifolii TaxID=157864 RepID=A0ABD2KYW8_9BILA
MFGGVHRQIRCCEQFVVTSQGTGGRFLLKYSRGIATDGIGHDYHQTDGKSDQIDAANGGIARIGVAKEQSADNGHTRRERSECHGTVDKGQYFAGGAEECAVVRRCRVISATSEKQNANKTNI